MKNIHLIPTDKPSRLYSNNGKLHLDSILQNSGGHTINQHIYITADLEIKEGEWFITTGGYLHRCHTKNSKTIYYVTNSGGMAIGAEYCKKVILTTDEDLIVSGVQAIDNTFAEWFVKNSSCEVATLEKEQDDTVPYPKMRFIKPYKIIIPQEESKQKYIGECNGNNGNGCFLDSPGHDCGCFVKVLIEKSEQEICNFCDKTLREQMKGCNEITCYRQFIPKETIEELAFEKYPRSMSEKDSELRNEFIEGAKWMEGRMFTKKDMIDFAIWVYLEVNQISGKERTNEELFIEWCNKFKKK
jgi:hypothetical protein